LSTGHQRWIIVKIMKRGWAHNEQGVQEILAVHDETKVCDLWLWGLQHRHGYIVDADMITSCQSFRMGVAIGDPSGENQSMMARCLQDGAGTSPDGMKSLALYREGAAKESGFALNRLAIVYYRGHLVPLDRNETVRFFQRAHEAGNTNATINLAEMLFHGVGVKRDRQAAIALWKDVLSIVPGQRAVVDRLKGVFNSSEAAMVIPYGSWSPEARVHCWVTRLMHREVMALLMARNREDGLFSSIPHGVVLTICFFLVTI
jgi:hypothetical protein